MRADKQAGRTGAWRECHRKLRVRGDAALTRLNRLPAGTVPGRVRGEINRVRGVPLLAEDECITNRVGEKGRAVLTQDEVGLLGANSSAGLGHCGHHPCAVLTT